MKQEAVNSAASFLGNLPEKKNEELSLKQAIEQLKPMLQSVLAKGYSYEEVAKLLANQGIKISSFTLKSYLPSGKRQTGKPRARRAKNTGDVATAESLESIANGLPEDAQPETAVSEAVEPATPTEDAPPAKPTTARRGRAKSAATETTTGRRTRKKAEPASAEPVAKAPRGRRKKAEA